MSKSTAHQLPKVSIEQVLSLTDHKKKKDVPRTQLDLPKRQFGSEASRKSSIKTRVTFKPSLFSSEEEEKVHNLIKNNNTTRKSNMTANRNAFNHARHRGLLLQNTNNDASTGYRKKEAAPKPSRVNDPFGIPACFYWTVDEVADWVDSCGYGIYKENFRSHFITGMKLMTLDACMLPKIGVQNFQDILSLCRLIRDQLHIKRSVSNWNRYPPSTRRSYIAEPSPTGTLKKSISYVQHAHDIVAGTESRLRCIKKQDLHYSGWTMTPGWDDQLKREEQRQGRRLGDSQTERMRAAALVAVGAGVVKGRPPGGPKKSVDTIAEVRKEINMRKPPRTSAQRNKLCGNDKTPGPYLPVELDWKLMEPSTGLPLLALGNINIC